MGAAIDRLDFILSGVLRVVFYRSLHMVSVPFHPREVLAYAQEQSTGGPFGGRVEEIHRGPIMTAWIWRDIRLGEGLTMDMWISGFNNGAQAVLVRTRFWLGNFSSSTVKTAIDPLGLVLDSRRRR